MASRARPRWQCLDEPHALRHVRQVRHCACRGRGFNKGWSIDAATGAPVWKHQPVPFAMDGDPD